MMSIAEQAAFLRRFMAKAGEKICTTMHIECTDIDTAVAEAYKFAEPVVSLLRKGCKVNAIVNFLEPLVPVKDGGRDAQKSKELRDAVMRVVYDAIKPFETATCAMFTTELTVTNNCFAESSVKPDFSKGIIPFKNIADIMGADKVAGELLAKAEMPKVTPLAAIKEAIVNADKIVDLVFGPAVTKAYFERVFGAEVPREITGKMVAVYMGFQVDHAALDNTGLGTTGFGSRDADDGMNFWQVLDMATDYLRWCKDHGVPVFVCPNASVGKMVATYTPEQVIKTLEALYPNHEVPELLKAACKAWGTAPMFDLVAMVVAKCLLLGETDMLHVYHVDKVRLPKGKLTSALLPPPEDALLPWVRFSEFAEKAKGKTGPMVRDAKTTTTEDWSMAVFAAFKGEGYLSQKYPELIDGLIAKARP